MPRQARLDAPGTLHHVIVREIEKRRIEDCGIPLAEAGRQLGVFTSAVSTMIRKRVRSCRKLAGVGFSVERGESIAKKGDYSLEPYIAAF